MKKISLIIVFFITIFISGNVFAITYKEYKVGDTVSYKGINFYVIQNSDENSDSVTLLKAEPLTYDEINNLKGITELKNDIYDSNGYGGISYSAIESCGYINGTYGDQNCTNDYDLSSLKQILEVWSNTVLNSSDLKEDSSGYSARLITYEELENNLGYDNGTPGVSWINVNPEYTPEWIYNSDYWYWTMSQNEDSSSSVWGVTSDGILRNLGVYDGNGVVRPVITLRKNAIGGILDYNEYNDVDSKNKVSVPNTLKKIEFFSIIIGFVLVLISIIIFIKKKIARGK